MPTNSIPSFAIPSLPSSSNGKENDRKSGNKTTNSSLLTPHDKLRATAGVSAKGHATQDAEGVLNLSSVSPYNSMEPQRSIRKIKNVEEATSSAQPTVGNASSGGKLPKRSVLRLGETTESLFCLTTKSTAQHIELAHAIVGGSMTSDPSSWLQVLRIVSKQTGTNSKDKLRLYRRATIKFPLPVDDSAGQVNPDMIAIWLAFAVFQAELGMVEEARSTYRYIENKRFPLASSFYIAFARFESQHDKRSAGEILQRALAKEVKPLEDLKEAMISLGCTASCSSSTPNQTLSPSTPKRRLSKNTKSPKRRKLEVESSGSSSMKKRSERPPSSISKQAGRLEADKTEHLSATISSREATIEFSTKSSRQRSGILSSRLSRKGLSGKAKRVEIDNSTIEHSDCESEDIQKDLSPKKRPAIKRIDLNYMWEWDPSAREKTQETKQQLFGSEFTGTTRESHGSAGSGESTSHKHAQNTPTQKQEGASAGDASRPPISSRTLGTNAEDAHKNLNADFLPLVHENNILHVNGASYAKLGVIGKGGSCKVYRALSKKCSVVAIKRVKLEGVEKSTIEGYANEISLLKRLRGNPGIIQLYDSEVDVSRKAIFLVMEVGEADLNHILQQRALAGTSCSLNMHFVRLTWQQMLSAVHCIHEARIIHSDLKPANFLFVRGALKLIDFGIAKAIQNDDTTNIYRESHIGTLNYMSPEAILDTETGTNGPRMRIGRASDVWSLGCILYEMIYGKTPFAKLHFIQKLQAIVNPNHAIAFPEGPDVEAIDAMQRCLKRNPEDRAPIVGVDGLLNWHKFLHPQNSL